CRRALAVQPDTPRYYSLSEPTGGRCQESSRLAVWLKCSAFETAGDFPDPLHDGVDAHVAGVGESTQWRSSRGLRSPGFVRIRDRKFPGATGSSPVTPRRTLERPPDSNRRRPAWEAGIRPLNSRLAWRNCKLSRSLRAPRGAEITHHGSETSADKVMLPHHW